MLFAIAIFHPVPPLRPVLAIPRSLPLEGDPIASRSTTCSAEPVRAVRLRWLPAVPDHPAGEVEINKCAPGGGVGNARARRLLGPTRSADAAIAGRSPAGAVIDEARCIGCTLCCRRARHAILARPSTCTR